MCVMYLEFPGYPKPSVRWKFDDKMLKDSDDFKFLNDGDTFGLSISDVFPEDSGTYTCIASNKWGESRSSCTLLVHDGMRFFNVITFQCCIYGFCFFCFLFFFV